MKPIRLSKGFDKSYKKRIAPNGNLRAAYISRLTALEAGERAYPLNDHALKGKINGKRAFSIAGDIRVIYEETGDYIIFLDIGSHNQVYNLVASSK
ncbi:MAG: type II toxin-antitoxin system RelE/ParE family toxin [Candidatus Saccharimonadales bacterium]